MKILIFYSAAITLQLVMAAYLPPIPSTPPPTQPKSIFLHPEIIPNEYQSALNKPTDHHHYITKTEAIQHPLPQTVIPAPFRQPLEVPHETEHLTKHPQQVVTSTQYYSQDGLGQYSYGYATSDGQSKAEARNTHGQVVGQYSYVDPQGQRILLKYIADKDGFRAEGDHLPVPVEMPEFLKKAYSEAIERLQKAKSEAQAREIGQVVAKEDIKREEVITDVQQPQLQLQTEDYHKRFYQQQPGIQVYYMIQQDPQKTLNNVPLLKIAQEKTGYYQ